MRFSLASFFASSIAVTILILALYLWVSQTKALMKLGIFCIYMFVIFILIRGFLPYDFYFINLTDSLYSYKVLPLIQYILDYKISLTVRHFIKVENILLMVWLGGSVYFLYKRISGYRTFRRELYKISPVTEGRVLADFNAVFESLFAHRKNKFRLIQTDIAGTCAIFGLRSPIILLPDITYTDQELKFAIMHELLHYKHKDFLIKVAVDILIAVHWWNPIIHYCLFPIINQVQELYVDHEINRNLSKSERAIYLETLAKTVKYAHSHEYIKRDVYALADGHTQNYMMQRLKCIVDNKVKRFSFCGAFIVCFLFIVSFAFVFEPSYRPRHNENGQNFFYDDMSNSYYIRNGPDYDLYLSDTYVYTTSEILDTFKKLPIYEKQEEIE